MATAARVAKPTETKAHNRALVNRIGPIRKYVAVRPVRMHER